ncbi:MAG TPA: RNA polymerase sigma factor [Myxococcales bacterium]|nr:RNA polymerase sigma factor [Myxococcales bacterium]
MRTRPASRGSTVLPRARWRGSMAAMLLSIDSLVDDARRGDAAACAALVEHIQDDIYRLSMRMLAVREDAEDATQEILFKVVRGLGTFRGESSFRTWVWRIGVNHLLRARRSSREEVCSFEALDQVLGQGRERAALSAGEISPEVRVLADEVRLSCTHAMLLSMDRDHRLAFILGTVFELDSHAAAEILEISPAAFRKRLERARTRLDGWMQRQCGLVNASAGCSCIRQVALAKEHGHIDMESRPYSTHPSRERQVSLVQLRQTTAELDAFARELMNHPRYATPEAVTTKVRELIAERGLRAFD